MFWRFGSYANLSTLNTLLEKPDVTLEEVLDESDLIQELKQSNSKLIEFLRDENVLRRLLEYVVAQPIPRPEDDGEDDDDSDEEIPQGKSLSPFRRVQNSKEKSAKKEEFEVWDREDKARAKNAIAACEILSSETWSILESLMDNQSLLVTFWDFIRQDISLDATTAGYFTKINETLLDKKTEDMIKFLKSQDDVIPAFLKHIDCAAVMDLLLKIISMEKSEGGTGVVDWLQSQELMPRLLSFLNEEHTPSTQTSAGDFIKAIVTISANASQNEQSCIGPNNLTRQLVSEDCIENLLSNMLRGGYPLTVGVGMIIEVIRKNNSDYDPDVGAGADSIPSSSDPIYLGTLLRCFAKRVPDFMGLLQGSKHTIPIADSPATVKRQELGGVPGKKVEPLGFDRFKTCELMAELLHCSNMGLLNERGSEAYVKERDQERERLRVEGALKAATEPESAVTEFSEDSTSLANGAYPSSIEHGSDGRRKLEVANNSLDEDGFEEVAKPNDFGDDLKDGFDDRPLFEPEPESNSAPSLTRPLKPRLNLDEEFVDEPLSSPRLNAVEDEGSSDPRPLTTSTHEPQIASPTSPLTTGIGGLEVNEEAGLHSNESPPIGMTRSPEPITDDFYEVGAPPLPQRPQSPGKAGQDLAGARDISPHPDDRPAPLFASKSSQPTTVNEPSNATGETKGTDQAKDLGTPRLDEGESNPSMLMSGIDQSFSPHFEYDVDGQPLVGDYLKMMFVEHHVVPTILDFFFRFPWNNFLHNVVYDVVQQVFNGSMDRGFNRTLAIDLFQTGRVTERIVEGQKDSDEAQARSNMRLGYMGHLTLVAEEVVKFSDRHPPEVLSNVVLDKVTSQHWTDYVEHVLSETRDRDNAILGGVRPDMSLGPRQAVLNAVNAAHGFGGGASAALANAGLNGGNGLDSMDLSSNGGSGTSNSNFGVSSNSLLSGFGSSSDEEDEEMDELEESEAASGQDSFLPVHPTLSTTPTPPTDPPPAPPPLNVPPSRARRQLAARLALHSQQRADAEAEGSPSLHEESLASPEKPPVLDSTDLADHDIEHDPLADPISQHEDDDDLDDFTAREAPLSFGKPSNGSQEVKGLQHGENGENDGKQHQSEPKLKVTSSSPPVLSAPGMRHLDLDDFANSPAADADDGEDPSSKDTEMKFASS